MADLLRAGATWLAGALKNNASQSVTYRRGANSVTVLAIIGSLDNSISAAFGGVSLDRWGVDFMISVDDLEIDGEAIEPELNDQIDYGGATYFVARPDSSQPWFYSDLDGLTYRIHTKFKS